MDVILALKWIHRNIKYFGGDENRVTLFGQSSGAAMVSALAISPVVPEFLFQKIIVQSGSAMSNWCYDLSPERNARDVASRAGLGTNLTMEELNRGLLELDALKLLNATKEHYVSTSLFWLKNALSVQQPYPFFLIFS